MLGWQDNRPLTEVLAAKDAAKITKALGYETCGELLAHYPRDYIRHNKDVGLGDAAEGDIVTVTGTITGFTRHDSGKTTIINVQLDGSITHGGDDGASLWVIRFIVGNRRQSRS